jgi:hypothetical protein
LPSVASAPALLAVNYPTSTRKRSTSPENKKPPSLAAGLDILKEVYDFGKI